MHVLHTYFSKASGGRWKPALSTASRVRRWSAGCSAERNQLRDFRQHSGRVLASQESGRRFGAGIFAFYEISLGTPLILISNTLLNKRLVATIIYLFSSSLKGKFWFSRKASQNQMLYSSSAPPMFPWTKRGWNWCFWPHHPNLLIFTLFCHKKAEIRKPMQDSLSTA